MFVSAPQRYEYDGSENCHGWNRGRIVIEKHDTRRERPWRPNNEVGEEQKSDSPSEEAEHALLQMFILLYQTHKEGDDECANNTQSGPKQNRIPNVINIGNNPLTTL